MIPYISHIASKESLQLAPRLSRATGVGRCNEPLEFIKHIIDPLDLAQQRAVARVSR